MKKYLITNASKISENIISDIHLLFSNNYIIDEFKNENYFYTDNCGDYFIFKENIIIFIYNEKLSQDDNNYIIVYELKNVPYQKEYDIIIKYKKFLRKQKIKSIL